jgi:precorrin-2 dehydrogenase/sirohydrochlorin ferrochelatase
MAKPYFTLNLDVVGKPCLIIGGDGEALEKSERLLEAKAELLVVAKKAIPELVDFLGKNGGSLELREVTPADIAGKFFVLNCVKTEAPLSKWIYEECLKNHTIISAYDQPDYSNAVMQALVRAGQLRIAIGTGGSSPGLAGALRKSFEGIFDEDFVKFSEWVIAMRECMIEKGDTPKIRKEKFKKLLSGFKIEGKISYPPAYRYQSKKIENKGGTYTAV